MNRYIIRGLNGRTCCSSNYLQFLCATCRTKALAAKAPQPPPTVVTPPSPAASAQDIFRASLAAFRVMR